MKAFAVATRGLLPKLTNVPGATVDETPLAFRINNTLCESEHVWDELRTWSLGLAEQGLGTVIISGEIQDLVDVQHATFEDVNSERISIKVEKSGLSKWCFFFLTSSFLTALRSSGFTNTEKSVWVLEEIDTFRTYTLNVCSWGGEKNYSAPAADFQKPRRFVRDLTYSRTPETLLPWLLVKHPATTSEAFAAWEQVSLEMLVFSLPYEIRTIDGVDHVTLKGPRSTPLEIVDCTQECASLLPKLQEAVEWVFGEKRDSEVKFNFFNYHLSLDWRDDTKWPAGLTRILERSLTSAQDAFSFYLQDQSKEALKSFSDLRKTLQEEVTKVQQSTRDVVTALWRDFAVAGVVLALRNPSASQVISSKTLQVVTIGAAGLLTLSFLVTIGTGVSFNLLAKHNRLAWREKLYAFIPDSDWNRLVEQTISKSYWVFWVVVAVIGIIYLCTIIYLLDVSVPGSMPWRR